MRKWRHSYLKTIIELSAAIRNVYAQLVLMNRRLSSTYTLGKIANATPNEK